MVVALRNLSGMVNLAVLVWIYANRLEKGDKRPRVNPISNQNKVPASIACASVGSPPEAARAYAATVIDRSHVNSHSPNCTPKSSLYGGTSRQRPRIVITVSHGAYL